AKPIPSPPGRERGSGRGGRRGQGVVSCRAREDDVVKRRKKGPLRGLTRTSARTLAVFLRARESGSGLVGLHLRRSLDHGGELGQDLRIRVRQIGLGALAVVPEA